MADNVNELEQARSSLGLPIADLWFRYFALGGMRPAFEVEAILYDALTVSDHEHDVLAVALNERFFELGRDHPVPYSRDNDVV